MKTRHESVGFLYLNSLHKIVFQDHKPIFMANIMLDLNIENITVANIQLNTIIKILGAINLSLEEFFTKFIKQ